MRNNFEMTERDLRQRGGLKWRQYPTDVLPAFVADMDFAVAPAVHDALVSIVDGQQYGYPARTGAGTPDHAVEVFADRMTRLFGWSIMPQDVVVCSDLLQAISATLLSFSTRGDAVIVQQPCYPPFRDAITSNGREFVAIEAKNLETGVVFDLEAVKRSLSPNTRMLFVCNPHNPTGRVFTKAELEGLANIALERDLIIVSDEVHAELILSEKTHIPMATLGPEIARRTVTLCSGAKTFNLAGLKCAFVHFGSGALQETFLTCFPKRVITPGHPFGVQATIAAFLHGQSWLDEVTAHLRQMRDVLTARISEEMPLVRFHPPEGTYMAWLDCSKLQLPTSAFEHFLSKGRVALSAGETFVPGGEAFVRLNFATSAHILNAIIDRMVAASRQ